MIQQVTRLPHRQRRALRPGDFVFVNGSEYNGRPVEIKSVTCSITEWDQRVAVWYVHFRHGGSVEYHAVIRHATDEETHG